ncbi:MAG: ribonucleoside-diphosphate reductase subunit alpha [Bdellovibrionaceae bacterium]|jgi:ribonucleoside-diphosphate reductase alpha chain|nr:ribonucleoside-diphosphate reductase subunit alpha [Pseudobdellovibrionaceae bacterium]
MEIERVKVKDELRDNGAQGASVDKVISESASLHKSKELIYAVKRNGEKEPLNLEKIHKVIAWAAEGLDNVSVSEVELKSKIQFFDGIKTYDIHETIIKAAADLISESYPNYQYLSARLTVFHLRKRAFGQFAPPSLYNHIKRLVDLEWYDSEILEFYTQAEFIDLDKYLDHSRDLSFSYAGIKQLEGKYLVQNRVTGEIFESPQFLYMMIAATLFAKYPKETRMGYVKRFYDATSTFKISLPTPIMAGVRTRTRQFSSCVLIECGDSLDSINATASSIVKYVSQRAGIGVNAGKIRAVGSPIRGGEAFHTGCIPFYKLFQSAVKSCSQGGVRGGAATLFFPVWHLEVESLLVLKNNRGVDENRVRHLDYGVQFNKLMYERLIQSKNISLFSPSDVPGLYDAFFADQDEFKRLYEEFEQDENIRKKSVPAIELFSLFASERANTGRIYLQNVDHTNDHGPFDPKVAPIRQSNLCLEIALPTQPLNSVEDKEGEIALCTLSAINLGTIDKLDELENLSDLVVRALDGLLDYQSYPIDAAYRSSMDRRPLGVGVINYAYYLAKNGAKYSDGSGLNLTHRTFEALQFWLLKASNKLAQEQGPCHKFSETKYAQGLMTIDTYKKEIDKICDEKLHLDWDGLRADIKQHGLRNSTVTALMPSETSSQVSNSTNGIEPPRGFVSVKASKDGVLKQVVPDYESLKDDYELNWSIADNKGYLQLVGVMQKFVDQAISANTNYDPARYPEGKVPMKLLLSDLLLAYKLGIKTLYYHNTKDGSSDEHGMEEDDGCDGGACKI